MADDNADPGKVEEERLTRTMSGAGRKAAIMKATHATPPKHTRDGSNPEKSPSSPGFGQGGGRAPMLPGSKPAASGPMPEWKRSQNEREVTERKKQEEEERRRKQYVSQIVTSAASGQSTVETDSAVGAGFKDPLQAKAAKVEEAPPPPEKTAAQTFFDPEDKEAELKREEEYMARRTGLAPSTSKKIVKATPAATGNHEKDAHLALNPHMHKLQVIFVDDAGTTINEGGFILKNGRLPVLAVENGLKVRDLKWKETGQAITAEGDGYSSINFGTRDSIEVKGHRVISG